MHQRWLPKIDDAERAYKRAADQAKTKKGELALVYKAAKDDGLYIDGVKNGRTLNKMDAAEALALMKATKATLEAMDSQLVELELFGAMDKPLPANPFLAGQASRPRSRRSRRLSLRRRLARFCPVARRLSLGPGRQR